MKFQLFNSSLLTTYARKGYLETYPEIKPAIEKFGVNDEQLTVLFDLICCGKLVKNQCKNLVELLLPRGPLKYQHILRILKYLPLRATRKKTKKQPNTGLLEPAVVIALLKWAIAMYDIVDQPKELLKFYGAFFHYLPTASLRPSLCHLLYFMTRRQHVKPYRIQKLLEIAETVDYDAPLYGLLSVYKAYQPDIIMPMSQKATTVFEPPLPHIKDMCEQIRNIWNWEDMAEPDEALYRPQLINGRSKRRRTKDDGTAFAVPDATTSTAVEPGVVVIRDVGNVTELAQSLDNLQLPDQMAAVLDNRLLQFMIACDPDETTIARISSWMEQVLNSLLRRRNGSPKMRQMFKEMLQKCIKMAHITKAHLPLIEKFLREYLKTWDGWENKDEIFELITFIKPASYAEINDAFLKPLYRIYSYSDVEWKARLILCYTEWFKNWALLDWKRHTERRDAEVDIEVDNLIWLFQGLDCNVDYFQTMQHFINHVDRISVIGLTQEDDHPLLQHAALSFFEFASGISIRHDIPEIIIPGASLIYRSFFSTSGMAMSRICGIIYQYKRAFEENDRKTGDWVTRHTSDYLDDFNTYVMDICSAVWRNQALGEPVPEKLPFSLTTEITNVYHGLCESRGESANMALSLTHSGCLAGFSEQLMSEKEDNANVLVRHDGPITVQLLKSLSERGGISISYMDYRVQLLERLKEGGFHGLHQLLYDCMTSLIERRQQTVMDEDE
ncbi:Mis6-domain-containing protein [Fennellomyces sp. T-0311]|nr:Mis6-domain-containing protein [Fennellomyces sp. T-0311]